MLHDTVWHLTARIHHVADHDTQRRQSAVPSGARIGSSATEPAKQRRSPAGIGLGWLGVFGLLVGCSQPADSGLVETGCRSASECAPPPEGMQTTWARVCDGPRPPRRSILACSPGAYPGSPCAATFAEFERDAQVGSASQQCDVSSMCINSECGWAECSPHCELDASCASRGLRCEDDGWRCAFDCRIEGYVGCPEGSVCWPDGRCGVPPCRESTCTELEVCAFTMDPPLLPEITADNGCWPRSCESDTDCGGAYCVERYCSPALAPARSSSPRSRPSTQSRREWALRWIAATHCHVAIADLETDSWSPWSASVNWSVDSHLCDVSARKQQPSATLQTRLGKRRHADCVRAAVWKDERCRVR